MVKRMRRRAARRDVAAHDCDEHCAVVGPPYAHWWRVCLSCGRTWTRK
jgi:hypothetical protein